MSPPCTWDANHTSVHQASCGDAFSFHLPGVKIIWKRSIARVCLEFWKSHLLFHCNSILKNKIPPPFFFALKTDQPGTNRSFLSICSCHMHSRERAVYGQCSKHIGGVDVGAGWGDFATVTQSAQLQTTLGLLEAPSLTFSHAFCLTAGRKDHHSTACLLISHKTNKQKSSTLISQWGRSHQENK